MPYDALETLLEKLVLVMDAALAIKGVEDPRKNGVWWSAAGQSLLEGKGWQLSVEQQESLYKAFHIRNIVCKEPVYVEDVWKRICRELERYKGVCWKYMAHA
jgi:hypothetical protein